MGRHVRVKCTVCGRTYDLTDATGHALRTQHYSFRFTRDVEIQVKVEVKQRAVR